MLVSAIINHNIAFNGRALCAPPWHLAFGEQGLVQQMTLLKGFLMDSPVSSLPQRSTLPTATFASDFNEAEFKCQQSEQRPLAHMHHFITWLISEETQETFHFSYSQNCLYNKRMVFPGLTATPVKVHLFSLFNLISCESILRFPSLFCSPPHLRGLCAEKQPSAGSRGDAWS